MTVTAEQVTYVANLAQIQLNDEQTTAMTGELNQLLGYMEVLSNVDTEGIEPLTHLFSVSNVMRPDIVTGSYDRAALLANAPEHTEEAFVVPKTVG